VSSAPPAVEAPVESEAPVSKGYADGVEDVCARLVKNPRLAVKMASGGTMGEDIANHLRNHLLGPR